MAELDPKEIAEAFDLRSLLETELARRSIQRRTEADIARVYAIVTEMAGLAVRANGADLAHWFELNTDFHNALLTPAECPHHMRALENTRGLIETYIRTEVRLTGDLHQAQQEHLQLSQVFVSGDVTVFVGLIREHSQHTRDRLLAGIERNIGDQ